MRIWMLAFIAVIGCSKQNPDVCCTTADQCLTLGISGITQCDSDHVCSMDGSCVVPMCKIDADCGSDGSMVCDMYGECVPSSGASHYTLTVQIGGSGAGSITSTPPGIACSSGTCTGTFDTGTEVQLAQAAASGSFLGWTAACSGKGTCDLTIEKNTNVGAMFGAPGEVLWAKQFGGNTYDVAFDVASTSDGNLIAVGGFEGTVAFGSVMLSSPSADISSMFVAKLDGLSGDVIWARSYRAEYGQKVAVDSSDNIYVAGSFEGTIDFGTGNLLSSAGATDAMVVKLGPTGDPIWALGIGGPSADVAHSIAVRDDHVAVVGEHQGVTIGGHMYPTNGDLDFFMVDLDAAGNIRWSRSIGGAGHDVVGTARLDSSDNLVVDGGFSQPVDFGMGALAPLGNGDLFVAKFKAATGDTMFAQHYGGASGSAIGDFVALDAADNIFVAGRLSGTVDFGGNSGGSVSSKPETYGAKYSPAGANVWVQPAPTQNGSSAPTSALVTSSGDLLYAGVFCGSITFYVTTYMSTYVCPVQPGVTLNDAFNAQLFGATGAGVNSMPLTGTADKTIYGFLEAPDLRRFEAGRFAGTLNINNVHLIATDGPVVKLDAFVFGLAPL